MVANQDGEQSPCFFILDQGGSATRAMIYDAGGKQLYGARASVATYRPKPGWVEQDPNQLLQSVFSVSKNILKEVDSEGELLITSAGLITQRSSLVCWDKVSGDALSPVLSWQDTRASEWLARQDLDLEQIYQSTGLYPNAHFGASKMRWCLDNLPAVKNAAEQQRLCIAPLACFLVNKLVDGSPYLVDPANASRTLLMNISSGDWDESLLVQFGIDRRWLPEIVATATPFGRLKKESVGFENMSLTLVNGDQSAAAFSGGYPNSSSAYINIGTGAFIYRLIKQPKPEGRLLNSIVYWKDKSQQPICVAEGTVNGAGSALVWFGEQLKINDIDTWIVQQFAKIDSLKHDSVPIFLNGVGGLGSPYWRAEFESTFIGEGSIEEKFVAIVESILFLVYSNFLALNFPERKIEKIVISGGLSRNDSLCQKLSDLTGICVIRYKECEASSKGAAFLIANGSSGWEHVKDSVFTPAADIRETAPGELTGLEKRYQQWHQYMLDRLSSINDCDI